MKADSHQNRRLKRRYLSVDNGLVDRSDLPTNAADKAAMTNQRRFRISRVERIISDLKIDSRDASLRSEPLGIRTKEQVSSHNEKIVLRVRRGKLVGKLTTCSDCKSAANPVWRYSDTNRGAVYLCKPCKIEAFERSFGHAEAMLLTVDHAHNRKKNW